MFSFKGSLYSVSRQEKETILIILLKKIKQKNQNEKKDFWTILKIERSTSEESARLISGSGAGWEANQGF